MKKITTKKEKLEKNGAPKLSGVDSILRERGSTYGDSGVNLQCMNSMYTSFMNGQNRSQENLQTSVRTMPNFSAHQMAIVMIMGKLARIATGIPHADNYDDIIGYTKIAKEHAILEEEKQDA